jgi:hypothetical protein
MNSTLAISRGRALFGEVGSRSTALQKEFTHDSVSLKPQSELPMSKKIESSGQSHTCNLHNDLPEMR